MKSCCKEAFETEPKEKTKSKLVKWYKRLAKKKQEPSAVKRVINAE